MPEMNPYLNFPGNTEEAFNLYKSVFGGEFINVQRYSDTPHGPQLPEAERNKIMHMALPISKASVLMGTDLLESMGQTVTVGNNMHIAIETDSKEQADRFFEGLSAGGTVTLKMEKMFWGAYFGMCRDRFGVLWMVSFTS